LNELKEVEIFFEDYFSLSSSFPAFVLIFAKE